MANAKVLAPGVIAPLKAPRVKLPEQKPELTPDPARIETELAITALAKGGFEEMDKAAQIPAGPEALARLQQLAGNEFVTQVLTGPGVPLSEPAAVPKAPVVKEPVAGPKTPEKPAAGKPEIAPDVPGAAKGPETPKTQPPSPAKKETDEKAKPAVPIETKKEGAAGLPLPATPGVQDAVKPVKDTPKVAAAPSVDGAPSASVAAWKGKVTRAAGGIPPKTVTGGKGASLKSAGDKAAAKTDKDAGKLPEDGSKAITPPKQPQGMPAIPEDVSKAALKSVDDKTRRKLDPVTLPPLVISPGKHMPEIGKQMPKRYVVGVKQDEPVEAKKAQTAQEQKDKKDQPPLKKPDEEKKKTPLGPATIKDEPAPAIEIPEAKKVDIGSVVAQLIAEEGKHAKRIVDDARNAAYRGALKEAWPEMGADYEKTEVVTVDTELRNLAAAAGVAKDVLDKKVEDRRQELVKSNKEVEADLKASNEAARKNQVDANARYIGAVNFVRDSLEKSAQDRVAQVKGGVDPEKIRKERDELIAAVDRKSGKWNVEYEEASKKFKENLDAESDKQIRTYKVAAQEDENDLNAQAEKNAAGDKDKLNKEVAEARVKYRLTKYWVDEQSSALRLFADKAKVKADDQATTFKDELKSAAEKARDDIRDWTARRLGHERSFIQKLLDWIADYLNRANVEAEAWAAKRSADNKAAAEKDTQFLDAELAKLAAMTKEERENEVGKLNDEQFAIIKAYFESGGDRVAAVAAGVISNISAQQRPELIKKFEAEVLATEKKDLDKVIKVGKAQSPDFDPVLRSDGLWKAFKGPGTKQDQVFQNLAGLTPVQSHALELQYKNDWGEDLRKRLDEELNDWLTWSSHDIDRANALLKGDPATAAAIELNQAMHGNWNGLDLGGTDEDTIFAALRNKSPSEIAAIKKAYLEKYGRPLEADLKGEMKDGIGGSHDWDRTQALLESDTIQADAVAADKAMHGGWLGLGVGTDRKAIEDIYTQMDAELEQEADRKGWDTAKLKLERSNRRKALDDKYGEKYKDTLKDVKQKPGQSLLSAAYEDEMSGAELRLVQGLHDLDNIKANAAKIRIEHDSIIYADDKVINGAVQAGYRNDYKDKKRNLNLEIDEKLEAVRKDAYAIGKPKLFNEVYPPEVIREMRKKAAQAAAEDARQKSAANFDKLEQEYNDQYKGKTDSFFGNPSVGFQEDIKADTQGAENDKAQKLIAQRGQLTDVQEIRYAVQGLGTGDEAKATIKGKSKAEVEQLTKDWAQDPELKKLGSLQEYVLDDYSGREYNEMADMLVFGEPETPQEKLAKAKHDLAFERKSSNWWADEELQVLQKRVDALQKQVDEFEALEAQKGRPDFDWQKYSDLQGEADAKAAQVDSAVSVHQTAVDVVTDTTTQVIGAVVTAVIVAVSILADVFTFGGAAAATPAEAAAISGVWALIGISMAGTALTMLTKAILKGDAYGWEDGGEDLALGLVDALMSLPTGGMGGKLLKEGGMLAKLAEKKLFGKLVANFLAHAAEGGLQSLPGAVLGNALNKENFKGGNAILNVLEGAFVQTAGAAVMSGGVGMLHVAVQTDLVRVRTDPEYQARVFEKFRVKNPSATKGEFLSHLDNLIITRTDKGFKDPRLQEDLHQKLLQHLPPEQKNLFAGVPIEVLTPDQFQMFGGSSSGKAVTIIREGKPVVVMRAGAQSLELSAEGFHLLQTKEPVHATKIAMLDESNLKNWPHKDIDTQFEMYNAKLDLEIDANLRALHALEEHQKLAANPADVATEIENTKANLENLKKRQAEVGAVTPEQKFEMANSPRTKPAYLEDPPRLYTKDPTLPKPKEGAVLPKRPIDDARREYDALKATESKGPLTHDQYLRMKIAENELKAHYVLLRGEDLSAVERRLFDQRPKESLTDYRKRLEGMRAEVERAGNLEIWVHFEQLVETVGGEITQVAELREQTAKARAEWLAADRAFWRQRRAMKDPRIKIDPNEPSFTQAQVHALADAVSALETQTKSLETRGAARSQAYEFKDIGKIPPCFVPGTPVLTPAGLRDIDALEAGDLVMARDQNTGEVVARRVVVVVRSATADLVRLSAGLCDVLATRRHPFWVEGIREWRRAGELAVGDMLRTFGGSVILEAISCEEVVSPTVNLEVEGLHNFFVGTAMILVHNGEFKVGDFQDPTRRTARIYRIVEKVPGNGERVIYVGKTLDTIESRFKDHLSDPHPKKDTWRKAEAEGRLRPELIKEEKWNNLETAVWEKHYIDEYSMKAQQAGFEMDNVAEPLAKETFDDFKRKGLFNGC